MIQTARALPKIQSHNNLGFGGFFRDGVAAVNRAFSFRVRCSFAAGFSANRFFGSIRHLNMSTTLCRRAA